MKKLLPTVVFLSLVVGGAMAEKDEDGFAGPNRLRTNESITIYRENDKGIATYVEGVLSDRKATVGQEVEASLTFFEDNAGAFKMAAPADELTLTRVDIDDLGMRHVRFQQVYQGLPVIVKGSNL